jgi:hypothetical protein
LDIDGFSCNFGDMKCLIKYNDEDAGLAYLQDKLYLLSVYESVLNVCDDKDKHFNKNETSSKLWHSRLGHISWGRMITIDIGINPYGYLWPFSYRVCGWF